MTVIKRVEAAHLINVEYVSLPGLKVVKRSTDIEPCPFPFLPSFPSPCVPSLSWGDIPQIQIDCE